MYKGRDIGSRQKGDEDIEDEGVDPQHLGPYQWAGSK